MKLSILFCHILIAILQTSQEKEIEITNHTLHFCFSENQWESEMSHRRRVHTIWPGTIFNDERDDPMPRSLVIREEARIREDTKKQIQVSFISFISF